MQGLWRRIRAAEADPDWGLFWALGALVLAFAFQTIVGIAVGQLIFGAQNINQSLAAGWVVGALLTIGYILIGLRGRADALRLEVAYPLLIAFGLGMGTIISLDLVAILVTGRVIEPPELALAVTEGGVVLWVLLGAFVLVVGPLADELLFRGALFPALQASGGVWGALLVSSGLYGLFHQLLYTYPNENVAFSWWYTLAEPLLFGLMLGVLRAATGSTRAALAAHIGGSTFLLLKTLLIANLVA